MSENDEHEREGIEATMRSKENRKRLIKVEDDVSKIQQTLAAIWVQVKKNGKNGNGGNGGPGWKHSAAKFGLPGAGLGGLTVAALQVLLGG